MSHRVYANNELHYVVDADGARIYDTDGSWLVFGNGMDDLWRKSVLITEAQPLPTITVEGR